MKLNKNIKLLYSPDFDKKEKLFSVVLDSSLAQSVFDDLKRDAITHIPSLPTDEVVSFDPTLKFLDYDKFQKHYLYDFTLKVRNKVKKYKTSNFHLYVGIS